MDIAESIIILPTITLRNGYDIVGSLHLGSRGFYEINIELINPFRNHYPTVMVGDQFYTTEPLSISSMKTPPAEQLSELIEDNFREKYGTKQDAIINGTIAMYRFKAQTLPDIPTIFDR